MHRSRLLTAVIAAVTCAAAFPHTPAFACSMCQCGDPTYRLVGNEFFATNPWRFSAEIDRYAKDSAGEDAGAPREEEREARLSLAGTWTPSPALRLVGRLPVVRRVLIAGSDRSSLAGLGDPELFAHVRVLGRRHTWAALMAGVRAPLGANDLRRGGERADEHLQPGSGAAAWSLGVAAADDAGPAHLYASVTGRTCAANAHDYRYGDVLFVNAALQRDLAPMVAVAVELNGRVARADQEDGAAAPNTGGGVLYATPRLQLGLNESLALRLGVQVPLAQHLLGEQVEHVNFLSGLTVAF